jgi:elongation factor P hydroxylase
MHKEYNVLDIQKIFNETFLNDFNTELIFGHDEPFYKAAKEGHHTHKIYSRSDFFASALHEIAHWCIAGSKRREKDDYGYWYSPDGRDINKQREFEKVEIRPQAIEKAFSNACSFPFKPSADNLELQDYDTKDFENSISEQFQTFELDGYPIRAQIFIDKLKTFYKRL